MQLNEAANDLPNTEINIITANMPFIVDDFKTKHKISNSNFNIESFGKKYGVQVIDREVSEIWPAQ
jgi:peroxiredoxin